jgi:hypothetical protein
MPRVVLLGGPFSGAYANLEKTPERILVRSTTYERIDDPDTDRPLDAYAALPA